MIASFVLGWLYQLNNKYIIGLNDVLSDRLKYIAQTMSTYNIKFMGGSILRNTEMVGLLLLKIIIFL